MICIRMSLTRPMPVSAAASMGNRRFISVSYTHLEIVEYGTLSDIFNGNRHHPYTEGLFEMCIRDSNSSVNKPHKSLNVRVQCPAGAAEMSHKMCIRDRGDTASGKGSGFLCAGAFGTVEKYQRRRVPAAFLYWKEVPFRPGVDY